MESYHPNLPGGVAPLVPAAPGPLSTYRTTPTDQAQNRGRCSFGASIYSDGPEGPCRIGLPCGKRSCPVCRPRWVRRGHLIILSGFDVWASAGDFRALTLTAPGMDRIGSADELVAWNASHGRRINSFLVMLRRLAPGLEFVRVLELQRRGAIHSHWIVRGASDLTEGQVRRLAIAAGFGHRVDWSAVRTIGGLARYLAGYMMKSRDRFPLGTRVLVCSQGWSVGDDPGAEARVDDVQPEPSGSAAAQLGRAGGTPETWIGGPPVGISWTVWAVERNDIAARREVRRRERRQDDRSSWEMLVRVLWANWERTSNGRAAVGRLARRRRG